MPVEWICMCFETFYISIVSLSAIAESMMGVRGCVYYVVGTRTTIMFTEIFLG